MILRIIIIFRRLQTLAIKWYYLGGGGLFAEFKSHAEIWQTLKRSARD